VKDKGANLNVMMLTIKSILDCELLDLEESFKGICFGHAFTKSCQYGIVEEFFCKNLIYVFIKLT
jgi:hypothetical protein